MDGSHLQPSAELAQPSSRLDPDRVVGVRIQSGDTHLLAGLCGFDSRDLPEPAMSRLGRVFRPRSLRALVAFVVGAVVFTEQNRQAQFESDVQDAFCESFGSRSGDPERHDVGVNRHIRDQHLT